MAEFDRYVLNLQRSFGSIPKSPSRESVQLTLLAQEKQSLAHRMLVQREREPWRGSSAKRDDPDEAESYDYWSEELSE